MLESAFYYCPPLLELALFFELGGSVLQLISLLGLIMWVFVFERLMFLVTISGHLRQHIVLRWENTEKPSQWTAQQLKSCWLSEYSQQLNAHLILIRTCIAVAPLMGLLGTVTGMIDVFDVMAGSGLGNTRAMAAGIHHGRHGYLLIGLYGHYLYSTKNLQRSTHLKRTTQLLKIMRKIIHSQQEEDVSIDMTPMLGSYRNGPRKSQYPHRHRQR